MTPGPIYVGYLPLPPAHRRTVRVLVPVLVLALIAAAALTAATQRDPGPGVWHSLSAQDFTGTLIARPYPMLDTDDGVYLVVGVGKVGTHDRLREYDGAHVTLSGFLLERDGRKMIELRPEADAVTVLGEPRPAALASTTGDPIERRGEILDSKCYLGAMKPGDGKAHKACATLCIDGGIPPMLFARASDGTPEYYILAGPGMTSAAALVSSYAAEPVTVRGVPFTQGGVRILLIDEYSVRRR